MSGISTHLKWKKIRLRFEHFTAPARLSGYSGDSPQIHQAPVGGQSLAIGWLSSSRQHTYKCEGGRLGGLEEAGVSKCVIIQAR